MVDQKIDKESIDSTHAVENALTALWEKAREASYLISTLRDEKKKLQMKADELEEQLQAAKNDIVLKQSQLEKIDAEVRAKAHTGTNGFEENEKRMLQQKVRNILTMLDQYLSP